jgi:uncharacterized YceG family protein
VAEDRLPPPRRVPAGRRRPPARRATPQRTARARAQASRSSARGGVLGRRLLALGALVVIAVLVVLVWKTFQPGHGDGSGSVRVTVPGGANAGEIGDLLAAKGVVASGTFFQLNATLTGRRGTLRPGDYTLARDMSYGAAIAALQKGPKAKVVPTVSVGIVEGPSIREEAKVVDASGKVEGSYLAAAMRPKVLRRVRRLGAPAGTTTPEGFLFPATYTLVKGSPAADLVAKQLQAFKDNVGKVDFSYAKSKNLTRYDVLTIASMVEREAQRDDERPLVAAVIYNRLKDGIPLGIDATIRYQTHNWTRPIRQSELAADTPYNTRLNQGLPPTPIGNPGLASLRAAANPAKVDYLYYVVKPGTCGQHAFSSTDAQFQRDLERYNAARDAAGGKSPTSC